MNKKTQLPQENVRIQFTSDGTMRLSQRHQVELACKMDTGDFPFDRQFCDMRMLSCEFFLLLSWIGLLVRAIKIIQSNPY